MNKWQLQHCTQLTASQRGITKTGGLSNAIRVQKGQRAEKGSYRDIYLNVGYFLPIPLTLPRSTLKQSCCPWQLPNFVATPPPTKSFLPLKILCCPKIFRASQIILSTQTSFPHSVIIPAICCHAPKMFFSTSKTFFLPLQLLHNQHPFMVTFVNFHQNLPKIGWGANKGSIPFVV